LRFWETNIKRNPADVVRKIISQQKRKGIRSASRQTKRMLDEVRTNRYKVRRTA
jgi:hypothetical protein